MAQIKIIWSQRAKIRLFQLLEFYANRNNSKDYSARLYMKFRTELKLLLKQPDLGIKTDMKNVRGLIIEDYIIYYEKYKDKIIIHTIWDSRQNPDDLVIK